MFLLGAVLNILVRNASTRGPMCFRCLIFNLFVNCLVKHCLVCVVVLCWIDHVWYSKECVCCACDPNERISAPSICFVCVFVCWKLSPHLGV